MPRKQELAQRAYELAFRYEAELGSCPQCVLAAIKETLDVGDPATIQAADALAGGTALSSRGTCGALVGGLLAISSLVGRSYSDFQAEKHGRRVFRYSKMLYDRFVQEYGSALCCDVQTQLFGRSFNLMDNSEYAEFEQAGAHVDKCPSVSGNVAKWTVELIFDELKKYLY
jgi:C_GCAxxG_C_C family probable redox protein